MGLGPADAARAGLSRRNSETHLPNANAANRALDLLGRELNLFTEKKGVGKPGDFDHMADEELTEFIEARVNSCASLSASC